jgi:hypothetical protein
MGLRAFEEPKPVAIPRAPAAVQPARGVTTAIPATNSPNDVVVVVPAQEEGFKAVFLGERRWRAIRIAGGKLQQIRYLAAYQTRPTSAVTHYASVAEIEPYGEAGKYQLIFSGPPVEVGPIFLGDATAGVMQGPRYTTLGKLLAAKTVTDLF